MEEIFGDEPIGPTVLVKKIWAFVKANKLQRQIHGHSSLVGKPSNLPALTPVTPADPIDDIKNYRRRA
jgi:hypothetical protein